MTDIQALRAAVEETGQARNEAMMAERRANFENDVTSKRWVAATQSFNTANRRFVEAVDALIEAEASLTDAETDVEIPTPPLITIIGADPPSECGPCGRERCAHPGSADCEARWRTARPSRPGGLE